MSKYQQATKDACLALIDKGCSTRDVERLTGVGRNTVNRWVITRKKHEEIDLIHDMRSELRFLKDEIRRLNDLILYKDKIAQFDNRRLTLVGS